MTFTGLDSKEDGVTVVELVIAMTLMITLLAMVASIMINSINSVNPLDRQARSLDEARLGVTRIARELRSAECVYTPAIGAGNVLYFETVATLTSGGSGIPYQAEYQIVSNRLERRTGANAAAIAAASPEIVATNVVNLSLGTPVSPFNQVITPRRSVVIDLRIRLEDNQTPVNLLTRIAGRNAWRTCGAAS